MKFHCGSQEMNHDGEGFKGVLKSSHSKDEVIKTNVWSWNRREMFRERIRSDRDSSGLPCGEKIGHLFLEI